MQRATLTITQQNVQSLFIRTGEKNLLNLERLRFELVMLTSRGPQGRQHTRWLALQATYSCLHYPPKCFKFVVSEREKKRPSKFRTATLRACHVDQSRTAGAAALTLACPSSNIFVFTLSDTLFCSSMNSPVQRGDLTLPRAQSESKR
jgi:hypothetical protein